MRKILALLLLSALLILSACSKSSTSTTTPAPAPANPPAAQKLKVVLLVERLGDRSFQDSAWDGMKRLQRELGDKVETKLQEIPEMAAFEENMNAYAKNGYDLVVSLGFAHAENFNNVAPKYPHTKFLLVDAVAKPSNVRSVVFPEHEGSYLVGALAALKSKTGHIGFIGGMDTPQIRRFLGGYEQGAKDVNPKVVVDSAYAGSWGDPAKGKELTMVMYNKGADVVYAAAGGSGAGTIEAAKETKKFAIGVDSNQDYLAPENMLASMIKRIDNAVFQAGKDLVEGKFTTGTVIMGLKEDGVTISGLPPINSDISVKNAGKENLDKVAKLRQDIIDGKIKVVDRMQETK